MKKFLFLIFLFSQSNFCEAQTAFSNSNSFNQNALFGKTHLNSSKKKKLFQGCELNLKISFHETDFFTNKYTDDSFIVYSVGNQFISSSTSPALLHYKVMPSLQINYSLNFRFYFLNRKIFAESGFQFRKQKIIWREVEGSHYADSIDLSHIPNYYPPYPDYSGIQKVEFIQRKAEVPILVGLEFDDFNLAIGTYRNIHEWNIENSFYQNETKKYFVNEMFLRNSSKLNPLAYLSYNFLNGRIDLKSFFLARDFNTKHPYFELGLELGNNFKEKK